METDLQTAISVLKAENCTCVLCKGKMIHQSTQRGVKPLLTWLDDGTDLMGFSAADSSSASKGESVSAFLDLLLGVRRVHGCIMSAAAVKVLRSGGIEVTWDTLAESIRNRTNTGPCPMEAATETCTTPEEALTAIRQKLQTLR